MCTSEYDAYYLFIRRWRSNYIKNIIAKVDKIYGFGSAVIFVTFYSKGQGIRDVDSKSIKLEAILYAYILLVYPTTGHTVDKFLLTK